MRSSTRVPRFLLAALLGLIAATATDAAAADLQLVWHDLAWHDNTADEDDFELERQETDSGNYTRIARLASNTTAFTDSSLTPETIYCYRIRAFNTMGESLCSQSACAKTATTVADSSGLDGSHEVNHRPDLRSQMKSSLWTQGHAKNSRLFHFCPDRLSLGTVTPARGAFCTPLLPRIPLLDSHPRAGEVLHPLAPPRTLFMHPYTVYCL